MADRDGRWDAPTEHDDQHDVDQGDMSGEDPPTVRATELQRARAREMAIAHQLANVNVNVVAKQPSTTLPPPPLQRTPAPAKRSSPPSEPPTTVGVAQTGFEADSLILLDRVAGTMPADHAPRRSESAAGGIVVVATGGEIGRAHV